jgi:hypothetical protein
LTRNWGIPSKDDAFRRVRHAKPLLSLGITAAYGIIGASIAAISFSEARTILVGLFRGLSLVPAVAAAGLGCWLYIYLAWPRFAAQFAGGDEFGELLKFYARAAIALILFLLVAKFAFIALGNWAGGVFLCMTGGAAAAAAFQTVMLFVPPARPGENAPKS